MAFGEILAKKGCPPKFITIVRQFHDGMHARVQDNGESSIAFPVTNGFKQGCVLAATLFRIMFSMMLFDAFSGLDNRINISYCTDSCSSKNQGEDWYRQWVSNCRWLFTECYYQSQYVKQFWQVLNGLWQFWPHHEHK